MRDKVLPKLQAGAPLTRHESAVYRRYEKARAERYRDEGMRALPQKDLESLLGTPRKVLLEWEADGLPRNADKLRTYDLWRVIAWVKDRWLSQAKGAPASPELAGARQRKLDAEADLKQLQVQREKGLLVPREEAEADRLALAQTFVGALERLASDFRSAFAHQDVADLAAWLDTWQELAREKIIEQAESHTEGAA
ncbi:MAG: hypothetical protein ACYS9X_21035 [Planctomycetota bacterium]|jgi:hypothetical protein